MIQRAESLVQPANEAGIVVPANLQQYVAAEYPHWHLLCLIQIDREMPDARAHFHNARIVATLTAEEAANTSNALERIRSLLR